MEIDHQDGIVIINYSIDLEAEELDSQANQMKELINEGERKFIINLDNVSKLSSQVLSMFINFKRQLNTHNGEVKIVAANENLLEIFEITMIDKFMQIFNTLESAKADFQ